MTIADSGLLFCATL